MPNKYDQEFAKVTGRFQVLRAAVAADLKEQVEKWAKELNCNIKSTKYEIRYYPKRDEDFGWDDFQDFIVELREQYGVVLEFTCVDRDFKWKEQRVAG